MSKNRAFLVYMSKLGRRLGVVVSNSSISAIDVQIYREAEQYAVEEQLVGVVDDGRPGEVIVGFLRNVVVRDPIMKSSARAPYIERPELRNYSLTLPYTTAVVKPYAAVRDGKIAEVERAPTPGSEVYVIDGSIFNGAFTGDSIRIGVHKYSGWEVPLDPKYFNYHVGVFGATGTGKSRLIRALIAEAVARGWRVIVFDHTGNDYAPYFKNVIRSNEIEIPAGVLAQTVAKIAGLDLRTYGDYLEVTALEILEGFESDYKIATIENYYASGTVVVQMVRPVMRIPNLFDHFIDKLKRNMKELNAKDQTIKKAEKLLRRQHVREFFDELSRRTRTGYDVFISAASSSPVVIDLSYDTDLAVKQAIVASVIEEAWAEVRRSKTPANTIFVIDEAQNYAPTGWAISKDPIETTAREGRKWGLSLILASQRIAGDIDPSIRANLGTVFFSRLTAPTDLREITAYLDLADVSEGVLTQLQPREFFMAGLMNPLRKPILLKIKEVQ